MSAEEKLATAKDHKDKADQAFKSGDIKTALVSYHLALTYLNGLDKSALKSLSMGSPQMTQRAEGEALREKTEVDEVLEKVYNNMSACHIKNGNWKRAQETAEKALSKNEQNYKAMFRKAKSLGEQGYLEKCEKVFADLKSKNPDDTQVVDTELARFRAIDKEKERVNKQKLKGFLNKAAANEKKNTSTDDA
ncbi:TPR-like protein [Marasmius fiardii PR-910]|nr:TPR-like protein [Marasmius fiardii PR-910]